jgi:hypothetical protein
MKKATPMAPTFYDVKTFEPLPGSAVAAVPMRPAAARPGTPVLVAPVTMPVPAPYRITTAKPLDPPGDVVRFVPARDRIVALGEHVRVLGPDLAQRNEYFAPVGTRLDLERDLVYMADPLGFLVGRHLKDRAIGLRLVPTMPRGYERHVLYADAGSLLLASVELPQMLPTGTHVPDITMFEWWSLGDLSRVDPSSLLPAGAEARAVTFTRTRPLQFAAAPGGDPLVLAQPGHVLWLDRELKMSADVVVPAEALAVALDVDAEGRALMVVRVAGGDHFWILDRTGRQIGDVPLPEPSLAGQAPGLLSGPGSTVYVTSGRTITCVEAQGAERWRAQMSSAPVAASVAGTPAALLVASGNHLLRVGPDGHADLLFEAGEPLTASPMPLDNRILLATSREVLAVSPQR